MSPPSKKNSISNAKISPNSCGKIVKNPRREQSALGSGDQAASSAKIAFPNVEFTHNSLLPPSLGFLPATDRR